MPGVEMGNPCKEESGVRFRMTAARRNGKEAKIEIDPNQPSTF